MTVTTLATRHWGSGFERARVEMRVFAQPGGGYLAHHIDSRIARAEIVRVDTLQELAGFFGYCPRAVSLYQELGIPVRAVA